MSVNQINANESAYQRNASGQPTLPSERQAQDFKELLRRQAKKNREDKETLAVPLGELNLASLLLTALERAAHAARQSGETKNVAAISAKFYATANALAQSASLPVKVSAPPTVGGPVHVRVADGPFLGLEIIVAAPYGSEANKKHENKKIMTLRANAKQYQALTSELMQNELAAVCSKYQLEIHIEQRND